MRKLEKTFKVEGKKGGKEQKRKEKKNSFFDYDTLLILRILLLRTEEVENVLFHCYVFQREDKV